MISPIRGTALNIEECFEQWQREACTDGWDDMQGQTTAAEIGAEGLKTVITHETARSIISENDSPDIPFRYSLNPYRGCEHGCIYCFARPSHAYLGLSLGLDFETRIFAKVMHLHGCVGNLPNQAIAVMSSVLA